MHNTWALSSTVSNESVPESKVTLHLLLVDHGDIQTVHYTYLCRCWGRVRDCVGLLQASWGKKGLRTSHWRCHLALCSPRPVCVPLVSHEYQCGSSIVPGECLGRRFGGETARGGTEGGREREEGQRGGRERGEGDKQNLNTTSEEWCTNVIIVQDLTIFHTDYPMNVNNKVWHFLILFSLFVLVTGYLLPSS